MCKEANAPWRDEELLRQKYVDELQEPKEIIEDLGCSRTTFYKWVGKFGLKEEREANIDRPWRDEERLRDLYVEQGLSVFGIGDKLGCHGGTIHKHLKKYGIETRDVGGRPSDAPYKQESQMREWYEDEGLSTREIADKCDVGQKAILTWLDRHGIETRKSNRDLPPTIWTQQNGYERIQSGGKGVFVHSLVAIADGADPYKVLGDQTHVVHHKKPIPWFNTHENLELVTQSEHKQIHGNQYTD